MNLSQVLSEEELMRAFAPSKKRAYPFPEKGEIRKNEYIKADAERDLYETAKQPFIRPDFTLDFWLSQGLTLVGAKSGHSKSTTSSNIIAGFLKHKPDTQVLVISNEETTDAILNRVACIQLRKNYMEYFHKSMREEERQKVKERAVALTDRVVMASAAGWEMDTLEDVQAVLESCNGTNIQLVVLDYYQNVNKSRDNPAWESFQVLKRFGSFLKDYGRKSSVPVVVFVQLREEGADFKDRIENDKTILNHAWNAVEIKPNFETKITTFKIHKQRFGHSQFNEVAMKYVHGRYEMEGGPGL